jgi:hypothetical protein
MTYYVQLNGREIPFVNTVTYLGVTFDRRMTWRRHIERTVAKPFAHIHKGLSSSALLSTDIKPILYNALIRSVMTYACPTREYAADSHLLILQRLQNTVHSTLMETMTGAHQSANFMWLSEFLTCITL